MTATHSTVETAMESAIKRIKENSPEIRKYFEIDEDKNIITKGEIDRFEIVYDLANLRPESPGVFLVPFTVRHAESDEWRQDQLSWRPRRDAAGILLAFDDAYDEVWESNFDLFDRYNARVTFFVQGEYRSFCNAALERGHEVGYHTLNHLNLPKVSRDVFFEEVFYQADVFRNSGVPITSFAYPFGLSEPWMHEELLKHYKILRGYGVTFRLYDSAAIRDGYIISRAIDTILFKQEKDFEAVIDIMLRTVKFIGGDIVLPLTSHDISDDADWGIKPHRLRYLLKTANDLQLNFYLFRDFN
jgi:peptidoglycan/xylan/chitin deacetylase (PgdA/CDA1 family)